MHPTLFNNVPMYRSPVCAVKQLKPTMLVGVSTIAGAFTKEVVELLAEINERPIIFPLSNPTSKAECTYEDAFEWTKGKVVFASGSPFPQLTGLDGKLYYPAQANNAYISFFTDYILGNAVGCRSRRPPALIMYVSCLSLSVQAVHIRPPDCKQFSLRSTRRS